MCVETSVQPLTLSNQYVYNSGTFSNEVKSARVMPFYKGEDIDLIENYRPLSVSQYFRKLCLHMCLNF